MDIRKCAKGGIYGMKGDAGQCSRPVTVKGYCRQHYKKKMEDCVVHGITQEFCPKCMPGKTLISNCPSCYFWGDVLVLPPNAPIEVLKNLNGKYRNCDHDESPVVASPANYGCVHWMELIDK